MTERQPADQGVNYPIRVLPSVALANNSDKNAQERPRTPNRPILNPVPPTLPVKDIESDAKTPPFGPLLQSASGQPSEFSAEATNKEEHGGPGRRNVGGGSNGKTKVQKGMSGIFRFKPRFFDFGSSSAASSSVPASAATPSTTVTDSQQARAQTRTPSPTTYFSDASTSTFGSAPASSAESDTDKVKAEEKQGGNPPLILTEEYASIWAATSAFQPKEVPKGIVYSASTTHSTSSKPPSWTSTVMVAIVSFALGLGFCLLPPSAVTLPDFLGLKFGGPVAGAVNLARAEAVYYPPGKHDVYELRWAFNATGPPGIFNSSTTPDSEYGIYNQCNMPHVRKREYVQPPKQFTLEYVEVIHRHQKRVPYASNTFFKEAFTWDCTNDGPLYGSVTSKGIGRLQWAANMNPANPWTDTIGPGFNSTCQFPQISPEGLDDSITHGADLRAVYFPILKLPSKYDSSLFSFRVTNNPITSQILSAVFIGLFPSAPRDPIQVNIQPGATDSLEPTYPCPQANNIRNNITSSGPWVDHLQIALQSGGLYDILDSVSGIERNDTAGWHVSLDHYYDNLEAKLCHQKPLPCSVNDTSVCVSPEVANTVFRLGHWEYGYLFRASPNTAQYGALRYGAFMLELKAALLDKASGASTSKVKYSHSVAHDGSISPMLAFLQIEEMVWPGMGAEVVYELYSSTSSNGNGQVYSARQVNGTTTNSTTSNHGSGGKSWFIRVLWNGQPMVTSTPLKTLDMVPLDDFITYIDNMIGSGAELLAACNA